MLALRRGSALAPELGARLALACHTLGSARSAVTFVVHGPGVDGEATVHVDGLPAEVLEALVVANAAFPAGVDTWLVAADGAVVGLPRSSRIAVGAHAGGAHDGAGTDGSARDRTGGA